MHAAFVLVLTGYVQDILNTQVKMELIDGTFQCLSHERDVLENLINLSQL